MTRLENMPIPDDWDGETWRSICIQWPDSVLWRGILRGLLSLPSRGRFWDGRTGTITTVQAVGRTIIDSNFDFPICGSLPGGDGAMKFEKHWIYYADYNAPDRTIAIGENVRSWDADPILSDGEEVALSVNGKTFAMATGDYKVHWRVAGSRIGKFGSAVVLTQDGVDTFLWPGNPNYSPNETTEINHYSEGIAYFSVNSDLLPETMQIRQYAEAANTTGQGRGMTIDGIDLVFFGYIEIWKIEDMESVTGPTGAPGPQGAVGPQGPNGTPGVDGPGPILRMEGTMVQWAQEDAPTVWYDLIDLCGLECGIGEPPGEWPEACELATRVTYALKEILTFENQAKTDNDNFAGFLASVYGFLFAVTQNWMGETAASILSSVYYSFRSEIPDWFGSVTSAQWTELKCMANEAIIEWAGEWDEHTGTLLRDWCYNKRDEYEADQDLYKYWDWLANKIDQIPYQIGWMATVYDLDVLGTIDCTECAGEQQLWYAQVVFHAITQSEFDSMGWSFNPGWAGDLVEGIGVVAHNTGDPSYLCNLGLQLMMPALAGQENTNIHYITLEFAYPHPVTFEAQYNYDRAWQWVTMVNPPNYVTWDEFIQAPHPSGWTRFVRDYSATPLLLSKLSYASVLMNIDLKDGDIEPGGNLVLKAIRVHGTGYNPFLDLLGWYNAYPAPAPEGPYY